MAANSREQRELVVKIVLTGLPGSGKAVVLRYIARRHAHDSIRVGEVGGGSVYATEFYWPEELLDGRRLRVRLFALSGRPAYNAVHELLITDCDGLVFAADVRPERLAEAQEVFRGMLFNLERSGRDPKAMPLVLQYHHSGARPEFDLDKMDRWLGIAPGTVERLTACYPREEDDLCAGVEQVVKRIAREACPEQEIMVS
jgi:hypothetical protein